MRRPDSVRLRGGACAGGWAAAAGTVFLLAACSGGGPQAGVEGDERLFVPEGLPNTNLNGQDEGLILVAWTLVQGDTGPALYAAVRNDTDTPLCDAGMITDFVDKSDQIITSAASTLRANHLYRLMDNGQIYRCIDPGETAMTAAIGLPDTVVIAELGALRHQLPYFLLGGIEPVASLTVGDVQATTTSSGTTYTGTVTNGFDAPVTAPSVAIFPVNRVGRPLGLATASADTAVPAGGTWTFATTAVAEPGIGFAASASATLP